MRAFEHMRAHRHCLSAGILAFTVGSTAVVPVLGQAMRSGGDNARAIQQMQQLATERTALQADNAKLKDEIAELKKKLDEAATERAAAAARARQLQAAAGRGAASDKQAADALEKSRSQMQELITRFRATAQDLQSVETDRNTLRGQQEALSRKYAACVDHNAGMYQVG